MAGVKVIDLEGNEWPPLRRLLNSIEVAKRADDRALTLAHKVFKPGDVVTWTHGEKTRSAEVVALGSVHGWYHAGLGLRSLATGKEYGAPASTILLNLLRIERRSPAPDARSGSEGS